MGLHKVSSLLSISLITTFYKESFQSPHDSYTLKSWSVLFAAYSHILVWQRNSAQQCARSYPDVIIDPFAAHHWTSSNCCHPASFFSQLTSEYWCIGWWRLVYWIDISFTKKGPEKIHRLSKRIKSRNFSPLPYRLPSPPLSWDSVGWEQQQGRAPQVLV